MPQLTFAKVRLTWTISFLNKASHIWHIFAEDINAWISDFGYTLKILKELSPEDLTSDLSLSLATGTYVLNTQHTYIHRLKSRGNHGQVAS